MDGFTLSGIAFCTLVGLKLSGTINWSWWWVWAPIWIDAAASVLIISVLAFFGISVYAVSKTILKNRGSR